MQTEKKTKISSVHFKYVGTDEQFNAFIKSVVKDYITDDSLLPDTEEEIVVVKKSACPAGLFYIHRRKENESMVILSTLTG